MLDLFLAGVWEVQTGDQEPCRSLLHYSDSGEPHRDGLLRQTAYHIPTLGPPPLLGEQRKCLESQWTVSGKVPPRPLVHPIPSHQRASWWGRWGCGTSGRSRLVTWRDTEPPALSL